MSLTSHPKTVAAVLGILLLAALLRFWGIDFGLPNLSRPDEQNISSVAINTLLASFFRGTPDLNPHWFEYPSFYIYAVTALYGFYYLMGSLLGSFHSGQEFINLYLSDYGSFHLLSRCLTALLGVLTVGCTMGFAATVTESRRIGLLSGLLLAVTYLHVRDSHFGVTDVPATFWISLALWLSSLYYRSNNTACLRWACIAAGFAAATKYPAGLVTLAVLAAYWLSPDSASGLKKVPGLLSLLALSFLGFFLATPYVLLDFPAFWHDFNFQRTHLQTGHGLDLGPGWLYHVQFSLWYGLGPWYLLTAVGGLAWTLKSGDKRYWGFFLFAAVFYLLIGNTRTVFVRYIIPLLPLCAFYAAFFADHLAQTVQPLLQRLFKKTVAIPPILAGVGLLIAWQSCQNSLAVDALLGREDTRTQARKWILAHTLPGFSVGVGASLARLELPGNFNKIVLEPVENEKSPLHLAGREFLNVPATLYNGQPTPRNETVISTYANPDILHALHCPYVALGMSPLQLFSPPQFELSAIRRQYPTVAHFSPYPASGAPPPTAYDQLDAFYVPFTHPERVARPGPEMFIFQVPMPSQRP